jgi:hypothetical protein
MKSVRAPQFLGNLYRDMRDRHLLLPAVALVVGLLAVPILLNSHSSDHSAPPAQAKLGAATKATKPAVVRQELGVTNYKKRLDRLQSKNPFHQQYTAPPPSAQAQAAPSASAPSPSSTPSATSPAPIGSSTSQSTTPTPVSSPPAQTSSGGSNSAAPHHHANPGLRYYAWRVSVKVGEAGHLKDRPEVQRLALLPSDGKPVVSFLGATEDGSKAVFLVSLDVDSVKGDGRCLPSHSTCQYVVMQPGDKAHFHYAPNNTRYNLVLVDIHPVDVTDKLPKKPTGKAQPQQKLPLLGDG